MLLLSIPLALIAIPTLQYDFLPGFIAMGVLGLALLVAIVVWFLDWYFILLGLVFFHKQMANRKEKQVQARLDCLQSAHDG